MWIKHVICAYRNVLSVFKGTTWIHMHDHNSLNWLKLRYYPLWTQVSSIKANVVEDADALILQCESKTNCKHFFHVQIIRKTRMYFPMNSFQRTGRAKKTHDPAQDLSVLLCDKVSQLLCDSLVDGQSQSQSHGQKVKFDKLSMVGGKPQQHQEVSLRVKVKVKDNWSSLAIWKKKAKCPFTIKSLRSYSSTSMKTTFASRESYSNCWRC
ncbi:unnamed protein product [Lactuca saligna]|uniref:Uncharacterized protein n=1 Tax=Lactuca saligna TaxID=75948 RepID=A0AA35Z9X1_LACSI|nr:unnamed protein product [Lactuca saligna]